MEDQWVKIDESQYQMIRQYIISQKCIYTKIGSSFDSRTNLTTKIIGHNFQDTNEYILYKKEIVTSDYQTESIEYKATASIFFTVIPQHQTKEPIMTDKLRFITSKEYDKIEEYIKLCKKTYCTKNTTITSVKPGCTNSRYVTNWHASENTEILLRMITTYRDVCITKECAARQSFYDEVFPPLSEAEKFEQKVDEALKVLEEKLHIVVPYWFRESKVEPVVEENE